MRSRPAAESDVLIVGAGPAGSTLAFLLAGRGWKVKLLDRARFPRSKPCGECVNPGAVATLERLGLLDAVLELAPVPLAGWRIRTARGHGSTGYFGPGKHGGLGISRTALDHALVRQAMARGVQLEEDVRVMRVEVGPEGSAPLLETMEASGDRRTRTARFIVGADGLRSVVARRLGMVHPEPGLRKISLTCRLRGSGPTRQTGLLHLADQGTVGLAPVEDKDGDERPGGDGPEADGASLWNGTVVVKAERGPEMKGNAEGFFRGMFDRAEIPWDSGYEVLAGPWPSGAFDWPTRRVSGPKHLLVGDAAGYFDPLTGQGIFRAVRSAELAATAIDRSLRNENDAEPALKEYAKLLERTFQPGRRVQRMIEGVVSRPVTREAFLRRIGATPGSLDALVRVTGDIAPARSLFHPRLLLALAGLPGFRPPLGG